MTDEKQHRLYENISAEGLEGYAESAGIGGESPVDFEEFEKLLRPSSRIIEVGCGYGRLGRHFIRAYDYTGIDNHLPFLEKFRAELNGVGVDVKERLLHTSFEDFAKKSAYRDKFDAVLFPWTVIGDFTRNQQPEVLRKSGDLVKQGGVILLDNPTKDAVYNVIPHYTPEKFFYDDWKDYFRDLGFDNSRCVFYTTSTGRVREITILEKRER